MIRTTMEKHTINWLIRKETKGALDFSISIQRKEVWDLEHKSNLIGAVLFGIPLESLLFEEDGQGGYLVLDGKQRSTTIIRYLRGEFAISDKCKIKEINGESIIGKKFSELSEELQEELLEVELPISTLRPLTEDEREILFFMRNQAVSLTNIELTRVLLGNSAMNAVEELSANNFFNKTAIGSIAEKNKCKDQQVVLECLLLDCDKELGFSSKDLMAFAEDLKIEGISENQKKNMIDTFKYLDYAIYEKLSCLKKIHIPMVYKVAQEAIKRDLPGEVFFAWMNSFFDFIKENPNNEYNSAVSSSSAKLVQVRKRINYMLNHFNQYIDDYIGAYKILQIIENK